MEHKIHPRTEIIIGYTNYTIVTRSFSFRYHVLFSDTFGNDYCLYLDFFNSKDFIVYELFSKTYARFGRFGKTNAMPVAFGEASDAK